jgi:lipopolysaccharide exporter
VPFASILHVPVVLIWKIAKSAAWTLSSRLLSRLIDFAVLLILARALQPEDFGLVAIALTIVTIIDTTLELPLGHALVTMKQPEDIHYETAFTIAALRAAFLIVLFFLLSWPVAFAYGDPRLVSLIAVLGLTTAARSLLSPRLVEQTRRLHYRPIFVSNVVGKATAAVAVGIMVWSGGGYWMIVAYNLISAFVSTIVSYVLAPQKPVFKLSAWRIFVSFAGWFSASQLVSALAWRLDRLLMGFNVRTDHLGQYSIASDLITLPVQAFVVPVLEPVLAALPKVRDDPERLARAFLKVTRIAMFFIFPVFAFCLMVPEWIVHVLMGPQWHLADELLSGLSISLLPAAYIAATNTMAITLNKMKSAFYLQLFLLGLIVAFLPAGLHYFGLKGVVGARIIVSILTLPALFYFVRLIAEISVLSQIENLWRICAAGLVLCAALWLLRGSFVSLNWPVFLELVLICVTGGAVFATSLWSLGGLTDFRQLLARRDAQAGPGSS